MKEEMYQAADCRLLYGPEHLPRLGITFSPTSLRRLEAEGKFPKRIRLGVHSVAWLALEIQEHIAKLVAERGEL